jgi:predicted transcriptional regulator of viral defense system
MPQYCGDFAEVLHAFEVRGAHLNLERITEYALKMDAATAKRLGWCSNTRALSPRSSNDSRRFPSKATASSIPRDRETGRAAAAG